MAGNREQRLQALTEGTSVRTATVRTLAKYAANSQCPLATLGFAARVDFDKLLRGTHLEVPFGQSPFAFRRGNRFEEQLRQDNHAPIFGLLHDELGYDVSHARDARVKSDLAGHEGLRDRAGKTKELLRAIVERKPGALNLIDGAVFTRPVGGVDAYFEADAVAAQFDGPIHAGEIKSFPTVDGQADPDKVGAAIAQVSIYILLIRGVVGELGGNPDLVSSDALLITPLNTGLRPTMTRKNVGREIDRAERILSQAPNALEMVDSLPGDLPTFGAMADRKAPEAKRLEAAHGMAEKVGTRYAPSCLASCGMSRLCRERAHASGDPNRVGGELVRLLPNVPTLERARELAGGAAPAAGEGPAAEQLVRAERLLARVAKIGPAAAPSPRRVA
jgi:hypothetical protein